MTPSNFSLFKRAASLLTGIIFGGVISSNATFAAESIKVEKPTSPREKEVIEAVKRDKIIECPANYAIGRFYLIKCNLTAQFIKFEKGAVTASARGKVHIKGEGNLALVASYQLSENLQPLQKFKPDDVQILDLSDMVFKDSELKYLSGLTGLGRLELDGTEVTDQCMPYLSKLTNLKFISFAKSAIKGTQLASLAPLKKLTRLELGHNNLQTGSLSGLAKLQSLKTLRLQNGQVSDQDLAYVGAIAGLECITMHDNPKITDVGLKYLSQLKNLRTLEVGHTNVTMAGLKLFADKKLRVLRIYENQFKPTEVAQILKLFPKTRIIFESGARKADLTLFAPLH